jgi:hypothetical protein
MAKRQVVAPIEIPDRTWIVWALGISLLFAMTRILALRHSPLDLLPDEAQYWSWSRTMAFGYFSKPPVIAWLIRATTALAGNDEWAVRLSAPLIHAATGGLIALAGQALFNARVGFFSALVYATLPGVTFSALIISTDVPLLFFWALALLAAWRVLNSGGWAWAIALGAGLGFGFLSKYAMGYFILGVAIYAIIQPRAGWKPAAPKFALAALLALIIVAPNLWWNAAHGWATVGHTAANANWGQGGGMHLAEALSFAAAQFGVFGPVPMILLIGRLALWRRMPPMHAERYLLALSVPVLVLMIVQSGISRAHANWAAVSYIAATPLVIAWLDRLQKSWPLRLTLALQLSAFAVFTLMFATGDQPRPPEFAASLQKPLDIFHQMRGWKSLADAVFRRMDSMPADSSVAADDREVMAELDYNLRRRSFPLVIATGNGPPGNQYELENAVTTTTGAHVLLIARYRDRRDILDRFDHQSLTDEWSFTAGPGRRRQYFIYELAGFKGAGSGTTGSNAN